MYTRRCDQQIKAFSTPPPPPPPGPGVAYVFTHRYSSARSSSGSSPCQWKRRVRTRSASCRSGLRCGWGGLDAIAEFQLAHANLTEPPGRVRMGGCRRKKRKQGVFYHSSASVCHPRLIRGSKSPAPARLTRCDRPGRAGTRRADRRVR